MHKATSCQHLLCNLLAGAVVFVAVFLVSIYLLLNIITLCSRRMIGSFCAEEKSNGAPDAPFLNTHREPESSN